MSEAEALDEPGRRARAARRLAVEAGFDLAGVAGAQTPSRLEFFPEWVRRGFAGEMRYLSDQVERRSALRAAFPWARSVLSVGLQYDSEAPLSTGASERRGWISRYAWGDDYHDVMRRMLRGLEERLAGELGPLRSRSYVDTGPLVERAWAAAAGLGAWGKNTCLLHPEHGSFFFLGEVVLDLELTSDRPIADMCGSCTACLEACPTGAFPEPGVLDARRCISYLTIELKGAIPDELRPGVGRHVFGCDLCQDVCPWNSRRRHRGGPSFAPRPGSVAPELGELAALDPEAFRERFSRSPVKRARRRGLLRNVAVAMGNSGDLAHREALERLADDEDPVVREHAAWALRRLERGGAEAPQP
jgi:epoxyqueuosine reductase